ncbi:MAG: hypothetical protein AAB538_04720 [Patescibacteria group bacterium]
MTLSDIQRKACESVLHDAEAGRRERGLKIAQQPHLLDMKWLWYVQAALGRIGLAVLDPWRRELEE